MNWVKKYNVILVCISLLLFISGCSSSLAESKENENVDVTLKEYSIGSGEIRLMASEVPVKVTIKNKGTSAHNFVIQELGVDSGILKSGDAVTLEINPKDKAVLQAKCTLPGHTEAGMVAKIIVSQ